MGLGHWGVVLVVEDDVWVLSLVPNAFNPPPPQPPRQAPRSSKASQPHEDKPKNAGQDQDESAGMDPGEAGYGGEDDDLE